MIGAQTMLSLVSFVLSLVFLLLWCSPLSNLFQRSPLPKAQAPKPVKHESKQRRKRSASSTRSRAKSNTNPN